MIHALLEQPSLLFLTSAAMTLAILRTSAAALRSSASRWNAGLRQVMIVCGAIGVSVFLLLNLLNLGRPGFFWHDEAAILSIAAAYLHGQPLYHARSAPALYALLYGPSTFLAYAPLLKLPGDPITLVRWLALVVNLAVTLLLYLILRRNVSSSAALALLPVSLAVLLQTASHAFGVRSDTMLLLCFSVALAATLRCRSLGGMLVSGIALGIAIDFKLTVIPAACLTLYLIYRGSGRNALLVSAATAFVASAGLFLLPQISFSNYMAWLVLSSRQGFDKSLLLDNMLAAVLLLAPAFLVRLSRSSNLRQMPDGSDKPQSALLALSLAAFAACILAGSKNGAGSWHLWPLLPFAMMWASREARNPENSEADEVLLSQMLASIALAATLLVLRLGYRDFRSIHPANVTEMRTAQRNAEAEIISLVRERGPKNIAMGYGSDVGDARSALRFELPLAGEDYFLDETALVELLKTGATLPDSVMERVLGCKDLWLIPRGEVPFTTRRRGLFPGSDTAYLFPDPIRSDFVKTHRRQSSGEYYDLWACQPDKPYDDPDR